MTAVSKPQVVMPVIEDPSLAKAEVHGMGWVRAALVCVHMGIGAVCAHRDKCTRASGM